MQGDTVATKIVPELQKTLKECLVDFEAKECKEPVLKPHETDLFEKTTHCPYCKNRSRCYSQNKSIVIMIIQLKGFMK